MMIGESARIEFRIVTKNSVVVEGNPSRRSEVGSDPWQFLHSRMQGDEPPVLARELGHGPRKCPGSTASSKAHSPLPFLELPLLEQITAFGEEFLSPNIR